MKDAFEWSANLCPVEKERTTEKGIRVASVLNVKIRGSSLAKASLFKLKLYKRKSARTKSQSMILRLSQKQQTTFARFFIARPRAINKVEADST